MPDHPGFYDLGRREEDATTAIFLSSLEPGVYTDEERVAVTDRLIDELRSDRAEGAVRLEIVGRNDQAIWGRALARMCYVRRDDCVYANIRFSARIDDEPSDYFFGGPPAPVTRIDDEDLHLCYDDNEDCPTFVCGINVCVDRICTYRVDPSACEEGQFCDPTTGCF